LHSKKITRTTERIALLKVFSELPIGAEKAAIEIIEFLFRFKCASEEQLEEMISWKGLGEEYVAQILRTFVKMRILNCFVLSKRNLEVIPEDAYWLYCLDYGAAHILAQFTAYDREVWFSSDVIYSSDIIARQLMVVIFYLQVLATGSNQIAGFRPWKTLRVGRKSIPMSAEFWVLKGGEKSVYLLDLLTPRDLQELWPEKLERLAMFLEDKQRWGMYYMTLPKFIFLAYNDQNAFQIAESMYLRTEYNGFRVLTADNMLKGIDEPVFYSYIPASDKNPAPTFRAKKLGIFNEAGK